MTEQRKFVSKPIDITVSNEEWELISRGAKPQSMEQKWVIFYREGFLNFHRIGHTIFRTIPKFEGGVVVFDEVQCRREIGKYYTPNPKQDETRAVRDLIAFRLKTPSDEPWYEWDPRYPRDDKFLYPDFSNFPSK